ncbi:MAG: hypothetical protein Q9206_007198, partial [Seirophora lacunosa]
PSTLAQNAKFCPQAESGNLCYRASVPDSTVSSGSGDVYFQIQGPASKRWIGLGQGSRMAGANIFVIYANADGTNVTLSPRDGRGHFQPEFNNGIQAALLEGSGIADGRMTANVRCSSCMKWQQSTLDVKSTSSNWIWAAQSGSSLESDSQDADLGQQVHAGFGQFTLDLTKARSGNSLNPFVEAIIATTAAKTGAAFPSVTAPTGGSSSSGNNDQDTSASTGGESSGTTASASSSSNSGSQERRPDSSRQRIVIAHGVIMSLAWVIVFPLGAIIIRALSSRNTIHIHSSTQTFAYLLALIGTALGIYIAIKPDYELDMYHPIIGLLVVGLATVQPVLGSMHHRIYKVKGERTWWAIAH